MSPRIAFHGENAACFREGFGDLVKGGAEIALLPDLLQTGEDWRSYARADIIVGIKFDDALPKPERLTFFHVPGAGYDAVALELIPQGAVVCNCFGHDPTVAEYVFGAILNRLHSEAAGKRIALRGFGHIGKATARRAKAFDMQVSVANRSRVEISDLVDRSFTLDELSDFWPSADFVVVSVPLTPSTRNIVDAAALSAMKSDAVIFNVGRGPTIDEQALYNALKQGSVGGAVIDIWYGYPSVDAPAPLPSSLLFHQLSNIIMTLHMSGWTDGTVRHLRRTIAENINRRLAGEPCLNVVRKEIR